MNDDVGIAARGAMILETRSYFIAYRSGPSDTPYSHFGSAALQYIYFKSIIRHIIRSCMSGSIDYANC